MKIKNLERFIGKLCKEGQVKLANGGNLYTCYVCGLTKKGSYVSQLFKRSYVVPCKYCRCQAYCDAVDDIRSKESDENAAAGVLRAQKIAQTEVAAIATNPVQARFDTEGEAPLRPCQMGGTCRLCPIVLPETEQRDLVSQQATQVLA